MIPFFRRYYDQQVPFLLKRRLINSPLIGAFFSLLGWVYGATANIVIYLTHDSDIAFPSFLRYLFNIFLVGFFCFAFVYYLLEYFYRRIFYPKYFPTGKLSLFKKGPSFSVLFRFYIFYLAVTIFPLFVLYNIVFALIYRAQYYDLFLPVTLLTIAFTVIGIIVTFLIGRSYQTPLVEMKKATDRIMSGDYDIQLQVVSDDEIGALGDSLNDMSKGLAEKEYIKDTFGRLVDPRVRDYLLEGHIDLGGELRKASILFLDIRDFTAIAERFKPDKVVFFLNKFFERMSAVITRENGLVNKYIGDSIMAIFGVPIIYENHADAAVRAAIQIHEELIILNQEFTKEELPEIAIGIGVHTGEVLAGNIGSRSRLEYTVIGDAVNTASRVEGLCKRFNRGIILTEVTYQQLCFSLKAKTYFLDAARVRGKVEVVNVYTVNLE